MMAEILNRRAVKQRTRACLKSVQVNAAAFTALYLGLILLLSVLNVFADGPSGEPGLVGIFAGVLASLIAMILEAGFVLYCMTVRRGERAEYLTLFDGFSMVGKILLLTVVIYVFISLWSLLFVFPGIWAAYRYRFAFYNLYENPDLSVLEALNMSKRQTTGYKFQLFVYDVSYIGWTLLSSLPTLFLAGEAAYGMADTVMTNGVSMEVVLPVLGSGMVSMLICSLWSLAVSLFYLPHMQCGELTYFETAKRTSGIGVDNGPSDFDVPTIHVERPSGPDNLGGF